MSEQLEPCPRCQRKPNHSEDVWYTETLKTFQVICPKQDCFRGPEAKSEAKAIAAWNTRKDR